MTLHEAMFEVLRAHGGGWMERDAIAREIARRDLFQRPSDGQHPPSDQIRLRARKPEYQHLFECSDTACTRIRLRPGIAAAGSNQSQAAERTGAGSPGAGHSGFRSEFIPRIAGSSCGGSPNVSDVVRYEALRERYRPGRLRVLLVAESPPDPGSGERRFFYSPVLLADNLYRGVVEAVYGERADVDLRDKPAVLERMKADGFWLIDAVDMPVNKLAAGPRARVIGAGVPRLVERCVELAPELGVIICHGKVYTAAAAELRAAGVRVLHDDPLPFPLGNWRAQFVTGFRSALLRAGSGY